MTRLTTAILAAFAALGLAIVAAPAQAQMMSAQPESSPMTSAAPKPAAPRDYGRFSVEVVGKGPDVILIPGLTSSREVWRIFVDANKTRYRFHMIQVDGFAGSAPNGNRTGEVVAPTAEAIAAYIESKKLKAPAVIGHSMGGEMALMIAARHPGDVGKVLIVDSLPFLGVQFAGPTATAQSVVPMADKIRDDTAAQSKEAWTASETRFVGYLIKNVTMKGVLTREAIDSDQGVVSRALHDLIVTDLRPELDKIAVPVTVLYPWDESFAAQGRTEEATTALYAGQYAGLKGVKLVRVDNSYHFIMFDQLQRFQAEAAAFLGG